MFTVKIMNMIEEHLQKLHEFAHPISKEEQIITEESGQFVNHLVKILIWKDKYNNKKHLKNINRQWLNNICVAVVKSSTRFKQNRLSYLLEEEALEGLNGSYKMLYHEYDINGKRGTLKAYRTYEEMEIEIKRIMKELVFRLVHLRKDDTILIDEILDYLNIEIYGV